MMRSFTMGQKAKISVGVIIAVIIILVLTVLFTPTPYTPRAMRDAPQQMGDVFEQWTTYRSPSERFVVSLPSPPQRAIEAVPMPSSDEKIQYDTILSQSKSGAIFIVTIIDYPPSVCVDDPKDILVTAVKEIAVGNKDNQIEKSDMGTFESMPGLDFVITNPNATIQGRAILKGRSLYVMSVADRDPRAANDNFAKLADSFSLTK